MYDLIFLVVFALAVGIFLYVNRANIRKEGLLLLYKAQWGVKLIDYVGKKYKRGLDFLAYVAIGLGYVLMAGIIYLFGKIVYIYIVMPSIVQAIKIPPIMPLIPYIDKVVPNLGLPPFYFTSWILILALVAIPHEFFHGIFMRRYGVKVKSTGFGFFPFFLPIFLAAFVEQDEKSFEKASNFKQMAILAAGTFANVLTAVFFFFVMWGFFSMAFVPAGVVFDDYVYSPVLLENITSVNGVALDNPSVEEVSEILDNSEDKININGVDYFGLKSIAIDDGEVFLLLYDDAPAINADFGKAIVGVNDVNIVEVNDLINELDKYGAGDEIVIKTPEAEYSIVLGEHPNNAGESWLGIAFMNNERPGIIGKVYGAMSSFKDSHIYYESNYEISEFVYNLLWWIVLICVSVALVNMLPVGIFDGGRFFYLTVLGITKSENAAKKSFKFVTWFFLFALAVLMAFWVVSFF